MHEVVEEPARPAVEGHVFEVCPPLGADPEACAVVAEQVFCQGDVVYDGGGSRRGGGFGAVFDVQVEPGVAGTAKGLYSGIGRFLVRHGARDDDSVVLGEQDAVHVVVVGVLRFCAHLFHGLCHAGCAVVCRPHVLLGLDELQLHERGDAQRPHGSRRTLEQVWLFLLGSPHHVAIAQDHFHVVDGLVEEAVLEGAALPGCPGVATTGRYAGELHDHGGHQAVTQGRLDESVHGDIGLYQRRAGVAVDADNVGQGADVDDSRAGTGTGPGAVCRAMEDAVGLLLVEEAAHGGGDFGHGLLVALHGRRVGAARGGVQPGKFWCCELEVELMKLGDVLPVGWHVGRVAIADLEAPSCFGPGSNFRQRHEVSQADQ